MGQLDTSAVVTGAGNGIGKALALELGKRGYVVIAVDIAGDEAEATATEVEQAGGKATPMTCDVTQHTDVVNLVDRCLQLVDVPDLVFSNAGAGVRKKVGEFTRDDLDWIFSLNVFGMIDVAAQFGEASIAANKSSQIVVTGSEHSVALPHGGNTAYTATKHALLAFAEGLRDEWRDQPPNVSILCPGLTQSRFWDGQRHRSQAPQPEPKAEVLMQRGMPAEELAKIAVSAAEDNRFFIFTHVHVEDYVDERSAEIKSAFEYLRNNSDSVKNYDVQSVISEMSEQHEG